MRPSPDIRLRSELSRLQSEVGEELLGQVQDRDPGKIDLLRAGELEQQVERPFEAVEIDDEGASGPGSLDRSSCPAGHAQDRVRGRLDHRPQHAARGLSSKPSWRAEQREEEAAVRRISSP